MLSLICPWTNSWVNNRDAGISRCHRAQFDVTVMEKFKYGNYVELSENNDIKIDQVCAAKMFNVAMNIGSDNCVKSTSDTINKCNSHPSVLKIQRSRDTEHAFSFHLVDTQKYRYPDRKVHGANIGATLGRQDQGGPNVGPMNLVMWVYQKKISRIWQFPWKDNPHCGFKTDWSSYTFDT